MVRLEELYISWEIPKAVDILAYTPNEFEEMVRESFFIQDVLRDGEIIYERGWEGSQATRFASGRWLISKSSAAEVQSQLYIALDQKYITQEAFEEIYNQAEKISKMESGFIKYLKSQLNKPNKPK